MKRIERPDSSFDRGLQHERTALAWERTAISFMAAGLVLARASAVESIWFGAALGIGVTALGSATLVWAGAHYEDLHGPLRDGTDVVHPTAARLLGVLALVTISVGLVLAIVVSLRR